MGTKRRVKRTANQSMASIERGDINAGTETSNAQFNDLKSLFPAEKLEELVTNRENLRVRLLEILGKTDVPDLISRASLTYLTIDPDTYKESESDKSPAHIEYLALQALDVGFQRIPDENPGEAYSLTNEAIHIVRQLFDLTHAIILHETANEYDANPNDQTVNYRFSTRIHSLGVRSFGYPEHVSRLIKGCLTPIDKECREIVGFTASDALKLTTCAGELISDRVKNQHTLAYSDIDKQVQQVKRMRRGREPVNDSIPAHWLTQPWNDVKDQIALAYHAYTFQNSYDLAKICPQDLQGHTGLDTAICRAFLNAFSCSRENFVSEHHRMPTGAHPLTIQPILCISDDEYIFPAISMMLDAIRPRMEDLLSQKPKVWQRYLTLRGKYLEIESKNLLASALPGSRSWNGIKWASPTDNSDLDGLVTTDDLTLRIQCKAGRLSASTRRGATSRMKKDLHNLVKSASDQHAALETAIKNNSPIEIGFSKDQESALIAPIQIEAIVCLDDVTVWSTEAHDLAKTGTLPENRNVPWILSLTDLMAVVDLLNGSFLAHYLLRRQRLERDGRISAHDELDWVGHYITVGLHFDDFFKEGQETDHIHLTSFTEEIDSWYFKRAGYRSVPTQKPRQELPEHLGRLIHRLESERPHHWIFAAVGLLDGDDSCRKLWDHNISQIGRKLQAFGWSNATQVFNGRLGMTIFLDKRFNVPDIREQVNQYSQIKAEKHNIPNWVTISEGKDRKLFIAILQRHSPSLFEIFTQPTILGN